MEKSLLDESTPRLPVTVSNIEFFPNSSDAIVHANLTQVPLSVGLVLPQTSKLEETSIVIREFQKEKYCRICGSENETVNLERIFGDRGVQIELQLKIYKHLHLQVERDDNLPQQVCSTCIYHLNICHHLLQVSQAADSKLRQLFLLPQIVAVYHNENITGTTLDEEPIIYKFQEDKAIETNASVGKEDTTTPNNTNTECSIGEDCALVNDSEEVAPLDSQNNKVKKVVKKAASSTSLLCHLCGKNFKHPRNLRLHKKTHLGDLDKKKFQCSLCTSSFRSSYHLSEHMNMHNNVTPYKCERCGKLFHRRTQLRQHLFTHSDVKFPCAKCELQFTRKSNLLAHMKVHKDNRAFACKLCGETFPTINALLSHCKTHSQGDIKNRLDTGLLGDQDGLFKCSVCSRVVTCRTSLVRHMRQHSEAARLECEHCGKVMKSHTTLEYHRRSQHSQQRPHNCATCGQGFMTKPLLAAHQTIHTGEKPFRCEICSSGFRSRNNLRQHMDKHKTERKYQCNSCDKKFKGKTALSHHLKTHNGVKPFICDICGRSFLQKAILIKHQKIHSKPEKKPEVRTSVVAILFTCDLCSDTFSSIDDVTKHREEVHNDSLTVVPLNVTSDIIETHIVTDDGQNITVSWEPF